MRGIAWTGGLRWAAQLISWASTLVIAHLLTPSDYGLIGMASVYLGLVALVNEFGLTAAILQRRDLTRDQIARLGGFGVLLGVFFAALSALLASPIASFFKEPAVRALIMVLGLNFVISAFAVLPRSLLARELRFARIAWIDTVGNLMQVGATLALAVLGFRYWSLAYGSLVGMAAQTTLALLSRAHPLAVPRSFTTIRGAIQVGWHVVVGRIAWYVYQSADFAIVGRVLGKALLGAYTLGWEIATVPVERVSGLVNQVTPGVFSAVQDEPQTLRRYYLAIVSGLALITFPASIGIVLTADLFVPVMLGDHWHAAILPLRLLALHAGFRSIDTVAPQVLIYTRHSRENMWNAVRAAIILPILFYVGTRWGTAGVAMVWIVAYPIVMYPNYRLLFRVIDLRLGTFVQSVWPALLGTTLMTVGVIAVRLALPGTTDPRLALALAVGAGVAIYLGYAWAAQRERLRSVLQLVRGQDS